MFEEFYNYFSQMRCNCLRIAHIHFKRKHTLKYGISQRRLMKIDMKYNLQLEALSC